MFGMASFMREIKVEHLHPLRHYLCTPGLEVVPERCLILHVRDLLLAWTVIGTALCILSNECRHPVHGHTVAHLLLTRTTE
jgi:hypothetical protein